MGRNNTYLGVHTEGLILLLDFNQIWISRQIFHGISQKFVQRDTNGRTDMKLMGVLYATMRTLLKKEKILQSAVLIVTADGVQLTVTQCGQTAVLIVTAYGVQLTVTQCGQTAVLIVTADGV
jgi:hypothetical protein